MQCAKCGHDNPDSIQFCVRCHAPTLFTCPACKHTQKHGGNCDQCGVDFLKYAMMLVFQGRTESQQKRFRRKGKGEIIKQILLFPITGGWSLLKYLRPSKNT